MSEPNTLAFVLGRPFRWLVIALGLLSCVHLFDRSFQYTRTRSLSTPSSYDWSSLRPYSPVLSIVPIPSGVPQKLRRVQHRPERPYHFDIGVEQTRCRAVKAAAEKAWKSYREQAWMPHEQIQVNTGGQDPFGKLSKALIDSLDTLWIMDMKKEFGEAVHAVAKLDWSKTGRKSCNIFETTVHHLGGLLSAYDLSNEPVLLAKAQELGDMLYMGFDTANHLPPYRLDFEKAKSGKLRGDEYQQATSVASLSLEFTRLAQLTGHNKFYDVVARITDFLQEFQNQTKLPGMWPTYLNVADRLMNHDNTFSLGAESGSTYEYVLKMHSLLGGVDTRYEELYRNASGTIIDHLLFRPMTSKKLDVLFAGTFRVGDKIPLDPQIQQFSCFAGGMFALGGKIFNITEHVAIGARLTHGCMWASGAFPHGIMPEVFRVVPCDSISACKWDEERWRSGMDRDCESCQDLPRGFVGASDPSYRLRPEAIESIFVIYRITGHQEYREAAWNIFQSIQKATETEFGNSAIADVTKHGPLQQSDSVASFQLGQTLKYLYLIFSSPGLISLDQYVLNTEGHPFRIPKG